MTMNEYAEEWKSKARLIVSDGWKICQDQILKDHILPYIGRQSIKSITPAHISEVLKISRDRGHAPNTQKKVYNVLSKLFSDAVTFFEIINKSPVRKRFHKPIIPEIERACMDYEQSIVFLEYVMNDPLFGLPAWIQCLAGPRVSEVQALQIKDFDFDRCRIKISKAYNKHTKKIQAFTKNKNHYYSPIPPMLAKYLETRLSGTGFACKGRWGGMISQRGFDQFLKRTSKVLGFDCGSSHLLRHACAKIFAEKGASDEDLQKLLGHKSLQSTKTYIHRTDKNLFEISKKIA